MTRLKHDITPTCLATTLIGCLKTCSDYLHLNHSISWIYGVSGHAFIMNIHPQLCPSGPTAFITTAITDMAKHLGMQADCFCFSGETLNLQEDQRRAYDFIKVAIDNDQPVFAWEMQIPEYYMITGYDDMYYYYLDFQGKEQRLNIEEYGKLETKIGNVFTITACPASDATTSVAASLQFALTFAKHNPAWSFPHYKNGTHAYDAWMKALQEEKLNLFGLSYNAMVWSECRRHASAFLAEARELLQTDLLDDLIEHYDVTAWSLEHVAALFPFPPRNTEINPESMDDALDELFLAKEAEKAALAAMPGAISGLIPQKSQTAPA